MIRVGVIGPQHLDSFASNIIQCLGDLEGVEAVPLGSPRPVFKNRKIGAAFDFAARGMPRIDDRVQTKLVDRATAADVGLIITVQADLMPSAVAQLRSAGIPTVLWFPDHIANLGRGLMFAADYSTVYFKDPTVVERVGDVLGLPAKYLPEAMNPHIHFPQGGDPGDQPGLVLAGNIYPTRARLLERLVAERVPLRLYGAEPASWLPQSDRLKGAHQHSVVFGEEKARVFRTAQAVLNNLHPSELDSMNCRLFEAAGSGAVVITEYRTSLDELFRPGVEVLTFTTFDELMKLWRSLEDDPDMGRQMGDMAAARALTEHTYHHRLIQVLEDQIG